MLRIRNILTRVIRLSVLLVALLANSAAHSQSSQDAQSPRRTDLQYQPPTAQSRPNVLQPIHHSAPENPLVETPTPVPIASVAVSNPAGPLPVNDRQLLMSPGHLNDIAFIDAQTGVAIGNQGIIWRTSDGGRRWSAVRTEWTGDLHSLVFADAKNGWIVGGRALPIRGLHEGVVLRTKDGGVTWRQLSSTLLTKLTRVGYDHKHKKLWAVGEPDGQFPTGLYESFDLGQNWNDVTPKLQVDHSTRAARAAGTAMTTLSAEQARSSANIGLCVGEEWILSNRLGIFFCAGDRAIPVTIATDPNTGPTNSRDLRFQEIRTLGNRLAALGSDGRLYLSSNRGQKWEPSAALPDAIDATKFRLLATSGESLWLAARVDQQLYHFNNQTQQWTGQTLPTASQLNSIYFTNERSGWIVGINGHVWSTQDGGANWQCVHRTQSGIAVLLLAATAEDIPQELVAHLAVNQGLQVGVLCGRTEVSRGVCEQAFWQNEVASVLVDPAPFDPQHPTERTVVRIRSYLESLQPRVILVCPPPGSLNPSARHKFQVQAPLWLDAAQQQRAGGMPGVAVMATLSNGDGETSISSQALATNVGQLLDDVAWQSKTLIETWRDVEAQTGEQRRVPKTWGIRRLALLEPVDMSWFQPQTAPKDSFGRTLPSRPIRSRTSAANLDAINQMTRKSSWMHQTNQIPTSTANAREQWQRVLLAQLAIPDSLQAIWLADLAEYCRTHGDTRKATLARWQVLQSALDKPEGLAVLLPTLNWLVSDEAQWEARAEARTERLKRFAELQQLFAQEDAEGGLSEEERRRKALHRFGVEPGMEDHVPPEAVEKILLLDKAQRDATRAGRINPDPEIARLAAVPESRMVTDVQSKQFQNRLGQLQHQTTEVSWDTPLESGSAQSVVPSAKPTTSVVDLPTEQRLQIAANLVRRAESLWPSLNGLPEWWRLKARIRQELRDVAQTEVAWNKLIEMSNNPLLTDSPYQSNLPLAELEQKRIVSVAMAEYGERFNLETLGPPARIQHVSHAGSTSQASSSAGVRRLAVQWTLERPYLDGQLTESFWQSDFSHTPLAVAQDEQYIFLGIRIPVEHFPLGAESQPSHSFKPSSEGRDEARLEQCVILRIDTDADDSNGFEIAIDSAGRIGDQQNGLRHWNPTVFVARHIDTTQVVFEMAIDLDDLSPARSGKPWRVAVEARSVDHVRELEKAWIQLTNLLGE